MARYQDIVEFEERIIDMVKIYLKEQEFYERPVLIVKRGNDELKLDITDTNESIDTAIVKTYYMADLVTDDEPNYDAIYKVANDWIFLD